MYLYDIIVDKGIELNKVNKIKWIKEIKNTKIHQVMDIYLGESRYIYAYHIKIMTEELNEELVDGAVEDLLYKEMI